MKDIAIFGAGGFGREVACLIRYINKSQKEPLWNFLGFFDDGIQKGTRISHFGCVLGGMNEINEWNNNLSIVIAIGRPTSLRGVRERIKNAKIEFPNLIHPSFIITDPDTFIIGEGNIIQGGCACTTNVKIGNYNILNGDISLGHDATIGDFNVLMPALRISGEVTIGNGNLIGVGSIILQQIKIGNNVTIGAGSVLLTKPKDNNTYLGNPAKLLKY